MDETGSVLMKFKGVKVPEKVNDGAVEVCCDCGSITIAGIYDFRDPEKVFFFKNGDQPKYDLDMRDYDGDDLL